MSNYRKKVIIIGANFAGLAAAKRLQYRAEVTLIDPSPYFEFLPNIHELISAQKRPSDLRVDRGRIISRLGQNWIQDRVTLINPEQKRIELEGGKDVSYDICIVTVGGINNYGDVKGAEKYAIPFKSVDNCHKVGQRVKELNLKGKEYSIVIAGGGSEGVEALGELLRYRKEDTPINIHLVEAKDRLLASLSAKVHKEVLRLCRNQAVSFHFDCRIEQVYQKSIKLSNGKRLAADLCIWTGGVKPNPLLFQAGLSDSENAWAAVGPTLQSLKNKHIFVAGDAADLGELDSKQAYFAMESGERAAANVLRFLHGRPLMNFCQVQRPYLYSFGDLSCFLIFHDFVVAGKPLLLAKESIYRKTIQDIQSDKSCQSSLELIDQLLPKIASSTATSLESFLLDPLDFLCNPPLRIL